MQTFFCITKGKSMQLCHGLRALAGIVLALLAPTPRGGAAETFGNSSISANPPDVEQTIQHIDRYAAGPIGWVAYSPDGSLNVAATPDGRIKFCRSEDRAIICTVCHCHVKAAVFSANGRLVATLGMSQGDAPTIKVWQVKDGQLLCCIPCGAGAHPGLGISGVVVLAGAGEKPIRLWDFAESTWERPDTLRWTISNLCLE